MFLCVKTQMISTRRIAVTVTVRRGDGVTDWGADRGCCRSNSVLKAAKRIGQVPLKVSERRACEIRLRAERKTGQLLSTMEMHGGDRRSSSRGGSLNDYGISHNHLANTNTLRHIPVMVVMFRSTCNPTLERRSELDRVMSQNRCPQAAQPERPQRDLQQSPQRPRSVDTRHGPQGQHKDRATGH
jgi:hypothetical protein